MRNSFCAAVAASILFSFGPLVASAADSGAVYPDDVEAILDQRDLHGATQAYVWGQALATSVSLSDASARKALAISTNQ